MNKEGTHIKKYKYTILAIVLFLFHSKAYSNECVFQAVVEPSEKTDTVKELYGIACHFFIETFGAKLNPKIKLNNVRYIDDWSLVSDNDESMTHGMFVDWDKPEINDIYINPGNFGKTFTEDDIVEKSVVFHELIHFFIKSANFEYVRENEISRDGIMEEALCLWAQSKYVETATGDRNLMDYILPDDEDISITKHFIYFSFLMFHDTSKWKRFVNNSIHFFNDDPKGKYNRVTKGIYKKAFESAFGGFKRPRRTEK